MTLTIGSLFTGYGGLDMAVEAVTGGRTIWRSDIDPGACKVIAHHWPDDPNLGDINAIDWLAVERPEILTGGFPCQGVSAAGRRAGLRPGTRSGLWQQMARAIDILRPGLVVAENFIVAWPQHGDADRSDQQGRAAPGIQGQAGPTAGSVADTVGVGRRTARRDDRIRSPRGPIRDGHQGEPTPSPPDPGCVDVREQSVPEPGSGGAPVAGDVVSWGQFEPAIRRWERLTRPAPAPTEASARGTQRLSPRFVEWMMGLPVGHVTDVPGLTRNEQLKVLGNGVVRQQAEAGLGVLFDAMAAVAA